MKFDNLTINRVYSNQEIMNIFNCSGQGGIRVSNKNKTIALISNLVRRSETNPYKDEHIDSSGRITYTGTGTSGDQSVKGLNGRIAESRTNGYRIFYFEVYKNNEYTFKGEFILDDEPYFVNELDIYGNSRKVIKFKLKLKTSFDVTYISQEVFLQEEQAKEKEVNKLSSEDLASLIVNSTGESKVVKVITEQFTRDVKVKQYTLRRAKGVCDLCENPAPFVTNKNEAYLESHHVIPLAKKGKDSIVNTVALCPNCHKLMHYGKNGKQNLQKLKDKLKMYIKNDNNISAKEIDVLIEEYKKNFNIKD